MSDETLQRGREWLDKAKFLSNPIIDIDSRVLRALLDDLATVTKERDALKAENDEREEEVFRLKRRILELKTENENEK